MHHLRFLIVIILFVTSMGFAQTQTLTNKLETATKHFTDDGQMRYATTSLTVLDAETGETVFTLNENVGLAPASTLKNVTAATAYYKLGKDYTYKTSIKYSGEIKNDTLYGDIIIEGRGDPTLGSWRYEDTKPEILLAQWTEAIEKAGIKAIKGKIVGDASVFDTQTTPAGWTWQDMGNYYGAGSSGLTWHENQYDLHVTPGNKEGEKPVITKTDPLVEQLRFNNELDTGPSNSGDQAYIYTAPYANFSYVRGTVPAKDPYFYASGSVPDAALFAANSLKKALLNEGIETTETSSTYRLMKINKKALPKNLNSIDEHASPPLREITKWFLNKSINLYGEHLIKTIALEDGKTVNTSNGVKAEVNFWSDKGIDADALHIRDGSGLSPGNRVTTKALAMVLHYVKQEDWYEDFHENLPVIHKIHMKSGHIYRVAAYSGFIESKEGRPLVFSFIVNNYSGSSRSLTPKIFKLLDQIK